MAKPNKTKTPEPDWKAIAEAALHKLYFAMHNLAPRGGGSGMTYNKATNSFRHWRENFADVIEMYPGVEVDREAMHALDLPKKQRDKFFKERDARHEAEARAAREAAALDSKKMVDAALKDPAVKRAIKLGAKKAVKACQQKSWHIEITGPAPKRRKSRA